MEQGDAVLQVNFSRILFLIRQHFCAGMHLYVKVLPMRTPLHCLLVLSSCVIFGAAFGQNHTTFPNVSGSFTTMWLCLQPTSSPPESWMPQTYEYVAEPATEYAGKLWGSLNGQSIGISVEGSRVFYYDAGLDSIITLYDFSLSMGDTAYFDNYMYNGYVMVAAVDTVTIEGHQRRRLILADEWGNPTDDWLEGIGSLQGLLRPLWVTPLGCGPVWYHYCAEYMDELAVPYTWCTDIVMPVEQMEQPAGIKVYPNPASATVTIERTAGNTQPYRLIDLQGRVVASGDLREQLCSVDLSGIPPGMYVLEVDRSILKLVVE
jgi:hypothetical protein